ncbi:hypothetical protein [Pampinifervens florentissimum]|uniref:hypothetical protein n=1 Tax=Pampinifervens florentissimum TaxID=1632019 RepID=UPI0013B48DD4|nr:hypothetical protein [Hydrogenobacter sp. T-8]QID33803.1 hypothetical protein G3M65_08475 [Hydrogenobacter sp. T-8]
MKEMHLSPEELRDRYHKEKLQRFLQGYLLRFKRTRPTDPFKSKTITTPPAQEILSCRAFSDLFNKG